MINGGTFSRWLVLVMTMTETRAITTPSRYSMKVNKPASSPPAAAIAAAMITKNSALAPQVKNGMTRMVFVLSWSEERVLVFIMAGTPHPNPMIIGKNARPETPNLRNNLSNTKAILAIYPLSSSNEKKANRSMI